MHRGEDMVIHCDSCYKPLGEYLYGKGGIEERAMILGRQSSVSLPDIICNECWKADNARLRLKREV